MEKGLFHSPEFVKLINEYSVPLIAHNGSTNGKIHGPEEVVDPKTKKKTERCPLYKVINCEDHKKIYQEAAGLFQFRGTPTNFIFDCNKKVLFDGAKNRVSNSARKYQELLQDAQKTLGGPMLTGTQYEALLHMLDEAKSALADKDYHKGVRELLKVDKLLKRLPQGFADRYHEVEKSFDDAGTKLIEQAMSVAKTDKDGAEKTLRSVARDFHGLEVAKRAKDARKKL